MKAIIYKTLDQNILKAWEKLWEKSSNANYTNSPSWFASVIKAYDYKEFVIITLYKKDQLVGIVGLVKEKKYGFSVYTIAPSDFVCGMPFLIDMTDRALMRFMYKELLKLGIVSFDNVPKEYMETIKANRDTAIVQSSQNYYLEIQKDTNNTVQVRHKKRLLRRSETIEQDLTLQTYKGFDEEAIKTVVAIDAKSNKQANGYNAFSDKQTITFYTELAKNFEEYFAIYILYHKKQAVAYQIAFLIGKTMYCSQIASMKSYEQYSIGRSLLIRLIEQVGTEGISIVDFGSGVDHVKKSLTKEYRDLYTLIITNSTFAEKIILTSSRTRDYLYAQLHKQAKIYAFYRKSKNIFGQSRG